MEILVDSGASVNKFSNTGYYPLHIAAKHNHVHIIEYLCNNKADLECGTVKQVLPIHIAAKRGHLESVEIILKKAKKSVLCGVDGRKWTALHYAAFYGHVKLVKLLCKYDAH